MPAGPRPPARPGAGPGRGKPRARTTGRRPGGSHRLPGTAPPAPPSPLAGTEEGEFTPRQRRRSSITTRALALAVVLLVLVISFASSLRIYVAQAQGIAETRQAIRTHQDRIAELQTQLADWNDPAFVETQARNRLGWVMPGEVGYRVVGENGEPVGGGGEISVGAQSSPASRDAWWDTLWGSVEAADRPAPANRGAAKPSHPPTITESTKPAR